MEEDNKQFVIADSENPRLQRARELAIRVAAQTEDCHVGADKGAGKRGGWIGSPGL